jgi:peptidyl-prolyl cis-trans isomerase-like 4
MVSADVYIETTLGTLRVSLYFEEAPKNTENFIKLMKLKYYHGQLLYLVEPDVFVQLGDPSATGKGGLSLPALLRPADRQNRFIPDEIPILTKENRKKFTFNRKGIVAMANSGLNRNASQFFITLTDNELDFLQDKYTIIGEVLAESFPVLDRLNEEILLDDEKRPFEDIVVTRCAVLQDPFPDPPGFSALMAHCVGELPKSQLDSEESSSGASPTLPVDGYFLPHLKELEASYRLSSGTLQQQLEAEEANEVQKKRQAAASRALTLEMIGDLEDAEDRPDEHVLFVCKLNAATEEEDLALIFSRFGELEECHLVRSKETGDSLQYAFIKFKERAACEEAYFKMNNALIDDRRIHVDFSQSTKRHKKSAR